MKKVIAYARWYLAWLGWKEVLSGVLLTIDLIALYLLMYALG